MKWSPIAEATHFALYVASLVSMLLTVAVVQATDSEAKDRDIISGLHTVFQMAVKRNDATTMRRILDDRFMLVLGDGKRYSRDDLLASAASGRITYEKQDEEKGTRSMRVLGDTAVITARLWLKGVKDGVAFDRRVWFSDIYVRTREGWRFAFCQTSTPLYD